MTQKTIKQLIKIANEFINTKAKNYEGINSVKNIHSDLQIEIRNLYDEIKGRIDFTNEETIIDSIANIAAPSETDVTTPPETRMFPKLYKQGSCPDKRLSFQTISL